MTEEIGSVSEDSKKSSENELQKTSEEKCSNTEENTNEMSLTYRDMCLRRRIAIRYSNSPK